jgi:hypothetical protein
MQPPFAAPARPSPNSTLLAAPISPRCPWRCGL